MAYITKRAPQNIEQVSLIKKSIAFVIKESAAASNALKTSVYQHCY